MSDATELAQSNTIARLEVRVQELEQELAHIQDMYKKQGQETMRLKEQLRLRGEALELIVSDRRESPSYCLDPKVGLARARGIARKALDEGKCKD